MYLVRPPRDVGTGNLGGALLVGLDDETLWQKIKIGFTKSETN
jgi:hypothetical protein